MKRLYFLAAIAALQIIIGSILILAAAQPVRTSENVLVQSGSYYHFEFGILGTGGLSGNFSELHSPPLTFTLFVLDDGGFASFRDGAIPASPLFRQDGTSVRFDLTLPGSGQYHVVAVNLPARQKLQLHADVTAMGLKTGDAIVAVIVLVGGLALVAASLMLSVWAWRRGRSSRPVPPEPSMDPAPDPPSDPPQASVPEPPGDPQDPPDDGTRIYRALFPIDGPRPQRSLVATEGFHRFTFHGGTAMRSRHGRWRFGGPLGSVVSGGAARGCPD